MHLRISIHLMLWFNRYNLNFLEQKIKFQYILCYGSTVLPLKAGLLFTNFNTSYVMVQQQLQKS